MKLFVSYIHKDISQVKELVEVLRTGGHEPWLDDQLLAGQVWENAIKQSIQECDAFVYVLSAESVNSEWSQWEFIQATNARKPIIPILIQSKTELPTSIQDTHYIDLSQGMTSESIVHLMGELTQIAINISSEDATIDVNESKSTPQRVKFDNVLNQPLVIDATQEASAEANSHDQIALFVYVSSDQVTANSLKAQFNFAGINCVNFGRLSNTSENFQTSKYFGIVLISSQSLASDNFMNAWREIVYSQFQYFAIRIDHNATPYLPYEFGRIHYFDLRKQTIDQLITAIKTGTDIQQTRIIANTKTIPSNVTDNIQTEHFQSQSLRRAWVKVSNYAATVDAYYDEYTYSHYNQHIEANLLTLEELLRSGRFKFDPLTRISIPKSMDSFTTDRYLYQAQPETAIVLQAICDAISPTIEDKFIKQTYGNRFVVDRREETVEIFKDYWEQYQLFKQDVKRFAVINIDMYYHRLDIKQYYPRINRHKLLEIIRQFIADTTIVDFLEKFLTLSSITERGETETADMRGLPAGIPLSHLLGNLLLHDIDQDMKVRTQIPDGGYGYFRYVDDVIFFGQSEDDTEANREIFERLLQHTLILPENEHSPLNQEKSTDHPFPANDPKLLASKLKGISGTLQLSGFPNLSEEERTEIANTIYQLLFEGSDEDGGLDATAELTRYTTIGIRRLIDLDFDKNKITNLIIKLLRTVALPSNNIKYLVSLLLDHVKSQPTSEFIDLIRLGNTPISLAVLQSVRNYPNEQIKNSIWEWVRDQLTNEDNLVLVREAALTLANAPDKWLTMIDFKSLYQDAHPLTRSYLLELGLKLDLHITKEVALVALHDVTVRRATLRIMEKQPDWFTSDLDIDVSETDDSEMITRIIYLTLRHSLSSETNATI